MRPIAIVSGLFLCCASSAMAQVTVDVSKVTCDQYVHQRFGPPRLVGAWLSGYYNAKRDNHVMDVQNFEANLSKLEKFCYQEKNFKIPIMQAVEQLLGAGK
jgi:acid stress chaperone HdeB